MNKRSATNYTDYIVLSLLVLLTVVMFSWELLIPASETTRREEILFTAFELLFSAAIGWSLQKIESRDDARKSVKQFAISAYRRILDIEKAVSRLSGVITSFDNKPTTNQLDIKSLINLTDGIIDTVNSSAADWQDILGEDLEKIDLYKSLKEDYVRRSIQGNNNEELQILNEKIEKIRSEIPAQLYEPIKRLSEYGTPESVVDYIITSLSETKEYSILATIPSVIPASVYQDIANLPIGAPLKLVLGRSMHGSGFGVHLQNRDMIGTIINPFKTFGIHDFEFNNALESALRVFFAIGGELEFEASFDGISESDRNIIKLKIRS